FLRLYHNAGIHAKAIPKTPLVYEIIDPAGFGMSRYVHFASRLTGSRAAQLNIEMTDAEFKQCIMKIKRQADIRPIAIADADSIIR
ncbi:hypothetical protein OIDMADRAFT_69947, partial [Oidiodendron maius Zn]